MISDSEIEEFVKAIGMPAYIGKTKLGEILDRMRSAEDTLKTSKEHCLCDRNNHGFDYHEKHGRLGKTKSGERWLTPRDLIDAHFEKL